MAVPLWSCCFPQTEGSAADEVTSDKVRELYKTCLLVNDGRLILHGMFARADAVNTNGRAYPKRLLVREVRAYNRSHVARGTALGELEHPSYASSLFRSLNVPNTSHQVLSVRWRGRELWGAVEVLPTPSGLLVWELYSRGVRIGVSSRSWASLVELEGGGCRVADDMSLITFDFVVDPSNNGAFLLPMTARFRWRVPDQTRAVQLAHLGVGSCPMAAVGRLPAPKLVQGVLAQMRRQQAAAERSLKAQRRRGCSEQRQQGQQQTEPVTQTQQQRLGADQQRAADSRHRPPQQQLEKQQGGSVAMVAAAAAQPACSGAHPLSCSGPAQVPGLLQPPPSAEHAPFSKSMVALGRAPPSGTGASGTLLALPPAVGALIVAPAEAEAEAPPVRAVVVPANAAMPGGALRVLSHYQATDDAWLPLDPNGRSLDRHLRQVAAKAHTAEALRGVPAACGLEFEAQPAGQPTLPAPSVAPAPRPGLSRDKGSSDSLQCFGLHGPARGGWGRGGSGSGAPPPLRWSPGRARSGRVEPYTAERAPPPSVGVAAAADAEAAALVTLRAVDSLRATWKEGVQAALAVE